MHRWALILPCLLTFASAPAFSQQAPSAQEIIKSLNPQTRGIRPAPTQAGPAAQQAAPAPSVSLEVPFASGSAELSQAGISVADALGQALSSPQLAQYRFRVEGHTDTVGSDPYNVALSQERAKAVVAYLEQKFGIPASRLNAVGLGKQGLLVSTPDQTPEARNRRVQVINLGS